MPKKSAVSKKRVTRQKAMTRDAHSLSFGRLFGSTLVFLLLGGIAIFLHASPHTLPLRPAAGTVIPTSTPIPSPTLYPIISHTQMFHPQTGYESTALFGMERYLEAYRYPKVKDGMSIDAFTIDKLSGCAFVTDSIQCNIIFSLKPHDSTSQTIGIDNGTLSVDGWMIEKHGVVLLRLSANNLYEVWSFAPGVLSATTHR